MAQENQARIEMAVKNKEAMQIIKLIRAQDGIAGPDEIIDLIQERVDGRCASKKTDDWPRDYYCKGDMQC